MSRLAPTAKIPDDAPLAPPTRQVAPVAPVHYAPPAMPSGAPQAGVSTKPGHVAPRPSGEAPVVRPSGPYGQVQKRAVSQNFDSITPAAHQRPTPVPGSLRQPSAQRPLSQTPHASNASLSFSSQPTGHSLGLIAIVMIIDLALAGTGALLLAKGLSTPAPAKAEPEKKSEATPPAPAPVAAAPVAPPAPTATPIEPATAPAAAPVVVAATPAPAKPAEPSARRTASTRTPASTAPAGPVTSPSGVTAAPIQPPSTESEINTRAVQSKAAFDQCRGDAEVKGTIDVAFGVQPDGSIAGAAAIKNTTGNAELAACLARVITAWRVTPYEGVTLSFVRPFNYQ